MDQKFSNKNNEIKDRTTSANVKLKIKVNQQHKHQNHLKEVKLGKMVESRRRNRLSGERDPQRINFQSRDRYGGNDSGHVGGGGGGWYRGRGIGLMEGKGNVEKWKHDLYDEANKSLTSKNEED